MEQYRRLELLNITEDRTEFDSGMDKYSSYRAGGRAEAICHIGKLSVLVKLISWLKKEKTPCLVIGRGSNVLVRDSGISGVVIILDEDLAKVEACPSSDNMIMAGGGLSLNELMRYCIKEGLSGLEFMAGIPGSVGGAAVMNAGAHGHEFCECLASLKAVTGLAEKIELDRSEIEFSYRASSIPTDSVVYRVILKLRKISGQAVGAKIRDYLVKRNESQPLDMPSCGSVFRNPSGDSAGRLIEKAGLKGKKIGAAMISPKHANFIVNTGGATASDILALMTLARDSVREKFGIDLIPEVRVAG